ncbi:acyl carrier protein [Desulfosporosinus sp. BICA1-9]|uniref:acyl carrier protein n=1 Tax=Desulfosporosinus sp. BICA1-9 TaxID=1531958 RepID=UPI00054B45E4|nr:phosphopantetheine-binding protein [Desulfosporosinus sp. BICA1-9]KJS77848.1 MAG: acyl carrier protein [Desulfosporosinus sp. BICA1-9]HBW38501.1 acyl carrier protein [Desulfosporosinus sp.]
MNLEDRIILIIQSVLDKRPEINLDSHLIEDLMVDSLDKLMILSALEDEFAITIAEDDFADVLTIKDIVGKLQEIV